MGLTSGKWFNTFGALHLSKIIRAVSPNCTNEFLIGALRRSAPITEHQIIVPYGYNMFHGCRNVSKSGTALVEEQSQQARGSRRLGGGVWETGSPSPADYCVWGSIVSSPSRVQGRAPAANAFLAYFNFLRPQNAADGDKNFIYLKYI